MFRGHLWEKQPKGPSSALSTMSLDSVFMTEDTLAMALTVEGDELRGAEIHKVSKIHYGAFNVRMKASEQKGVMSAFFLYDTPGGIVEEIDVELAGDPEKDDCDWNEVLFVVRSNWREGVDGYNNGPNSFQVPQDKIHYPDNFDKRHWHDYTIIWTSEEITYLIDGEKAAVVNLSNSTLFSLPSHPMRVIANCWVPGWLDAPQTSSAMLIDSYTERTIAICTPEDGASLSGQKHRVEGVCAGLAGETVRVVVHTDRKYDGGSAVVQRDGTWSAEVNIGPSYTASGLNAQIYATSSDCVVAGGVVTKDGTIISPAISVYRRSDWSESIDGKFTGHTVPSKVTEDEEFSAKVTIKNTGNTRQTFTISLPSSRDYSVDDRIKKVTIDPNSEGTATFKVTFGKPSNGRTLSFTLSNSSGVTLDTLTSSTIEVEEEESSDEHYVQDGVELTYREMLSSQIYKFEDGDVELQVIAPLTQKSGRWSDEIYIEVWNKTGRTLHLDLNDWIHYYNDIDTNADVYEEGDTVYDDDGDPMEVPENYALVTKEWRDVRSGDMRSISIRVKSSKSTYHRVRATLDLEGYDSSKYVHMPLLDMEDVGSFDFSNDKQGWRSLRFRVKED